MFNDLMGKIMRTVKPSRRLDDRFLFYLELANAGMLDDGNPFCIDLAMEQLESDAPMLEIGSFCGLSANLITHLARKHGRRNLFFTCDRWLFENSGQADSHIGTSPVKYAQLSAYTKESFLHSVRTFSPDRLPCTLELFSDEFFDSWRRKLHVRDVFDRQVKLGGPISFCYIDGAHKLEQVRRDFANTHEILVPGGFILFDDSHRYSGFRIWELMREIAARRDYRLVLRNPNYLWQKK